MVKVELHTWQGKRGEVTLVDGCAVPDEKAAPFLDGYTVYEPGTFQVLSYADGARYLRALPLVINGPRYGR